MLDFLGLSISRYFELFDLCGFLNYDLCLFWGGG